MFFLLICVCGEPTWIDVPVLRPMATCRGSAALADIESRMPAGHQYAFPAMPMTWGHETTHGLNSNLRMGRPNSNVIYCMDGKAAIVKEPKGRLSAVAARIPKSLRGPSFNLYFVQQGQWWETIPTYLLDEGTSYLNGSLVGREVRENGWHFELLQAINFTVYSLAMAQAVTASDPTYDHSQLRGVIDYNSNRVLEIWNELDASGVDDTHVRQIRAYLAAWRTGTEAAELRAFAQEYLGRSILGE
jgi:hypothetical protein